MSLVTLFFGSWVAHAKIILRHRVFAELLEQGMRSNLTLPVHRPAQAPPAAIAAASQALQSVQPGSLEIDAMRALGLNPSHALQHPGFYYFMAARATEKRRGRFHAMMQNVRIYTSCPF